MRKLTQTFEALAKATVRANGQMKRRAHGSRHEEQQEKQPADGKLGAWGTRASDPLGKQQSGDRQQGQKDQAQGGLLLQQKSMTAQPVHRKGLSQSPIESRARKALGIDRSAPGGYAPCSLRAAW